MSGFSKQFLNLQKAIRQQALIHKRLAEQQRQFGEALRRSVELSRRSIEEPLRQIVQQQQQFVESFQRSVELPRRRLEDEYFDDSNSLPIHFDKLSTFQSVFLNSRRKLLNLSVALPKH